jgi:hypothetical protein
MTIENQNGHIYINGKKYVDCTIEEQRDFNEFLRLYKKNNQIYYAVKGKNKTKITKELAELTGKSPDSIYNFWLNGKCNVPEKYFDEVLAIIKKS